jgi:hypothetical protein
VSQLLDATSHPYRPLCPGTALVAARHSRNWSKDKNAPVANEEGRIPRSAITCSKSGVCLAPRGPPCPLWIIRDGLELAVHRSREISKRGRCGSGILSNGHKAIHQSSLRHALPTQPIGFEPRRFNKGRGSGRYFRSFSAATGSAVWAIGLVAESRPTLA